MNCDSNNLMQKKCETGCGLLNQCGQNIQQTFWASKHTFTSPFNFWQKRTGGLLSVFTTEMTLANEISGYGRVPPEIAIKNYNIFDRQYLRNSELFYKLFEGVIGYILVKISCLNLF